MRRRIESEILREYFETAWQMLPAHERKRLRSFIRYVDEVGLLEGTFIYGRPAKGKGVEIIMGPLEGGCGYAALMELNSEFVADVLLPSNPLTTFSEGAAIGVILHELAHVAAYANAPKRASGRNHLRSETGAWTQAMAWACQSEVSDALSSELELHARRAMLQDLLLEA